MDKIIVVECISTSMNYIPDIRNLGYEPVILETYNDDGGKQKARREANYKNMPGEMPRTIEAKPSYEETLELVKAENPILVLPGSEMSVELATHLANDLGLKCNKAENLMMMTRKSEMQNACKRAGLRYVKGEMVASFDDAVKFFNDNGRRPVVVKPTHSAGSLSVHVCTNEEEIKAGFDDVFGSRDMFGGLNDKVLIQECIEGTEYIVNTINSEGESYISASYVYKKIQLPGGAKIYDYTESLTKDEITPELQEMFDYAIKVMRAIGIEYGPVHSEFMIDDKGPVLIEVNCRICGGDMKGEFLDTMFGHHESNLSLEAYLDHDAFMKRKQRGYNPPGKGCFKTLIVREDIDIVDAPIVRVAKSLPTFVSCVGLYEHTPMHLKKTIDLYSNGGKLSFASSDVAQVIADREEIRRIERDEYDTMFTLA
ncbi:MAG: ATP-grasp domain-containing protein [Coriobacteriia bacterium]|nr:ATP-grasp domain-containing protein [Coriobacteriia bacterium]